MRISEDEKALLFLSAPGSRKKRLVRSARLAAPGLLERLGFARVGVTLMSSLTVDPFRALSQARAYQVTVELRSGAGRDTLSESAGWFLSELGDLVDPSQCAVVVGRDHVFKECAPQPVRFQYLMRRRGDFTHEEYSKRYAEVHSVFGMKTRGNEGYVQFHADPEGSKGIAGAIGCGCWDFDSVAQLDLKSMLGFFALGPYNATLGGLEDERLFVDREASSMFVSKIVERLSR